MRTDVRVMISVLGGPCSKPVLDMVGVGAGAGAGAGAAGAGDESVVVVVEDAVVFWRLGGGGCDEKWDGEAGATSARIAGTRESSSV